MSENDLLFLSFIVALPIVSVILMNWIKRRYVDKMWREIQAMPPEKKARIMASIENNQDKNPPL